MDTGANKTIGVRRLPARLARLVALLLLATCNRSPGGPASGRTAPLRVVPATSDTMLIRDEVNALVAESESGRPVTVVLAMEYIFGWGCDCPPFVFRKSGGQTQYDEEYVFPTFADGVPDAVYQVRGEFDFTGHYTGRRIDMFRWYEERGEHVGRRSVVFDERREWEQPHPEFLVEGWCYAPPDHLVEPEWEVPELTTMREAGVPLCPGADWPAWLDDPIPDAGP